MAMNFTPPDIQQASEQARILQLLQAAGYKAQPEAPPQLAPSPGLRLGPLHVGGGTLDELSSAVLRNPPPGNMRGAAGVAGGFAQGFARARAGRAQARSQAFEGAAKGVADRNEARQKYLEKTLSEQESRKAAKELKQTPLGDQRKGFGSQTFTLPDGTVIPMTAAIASGLAKQQGVIPGKLSVASTVSPDTERQATAIARAIVAGRQPPTLTNMGRGGLAGEVRRKLEEDHGYDLNGAGLDFGATQSFLRSANNPLAVRMRGSASTAFESTRLIDKLSEQLKQIDPELRGGLAPLNRARLAIAMNGPDPKLRALARQLNGQIQTVIFELGNVNMGGNSPTDQGMKRAAAELSSDWDDATLRSMTELARQNLRIRLNSINNIRAYTTKGLQTEDIEKGGEAPAATPAAPAPGKGGGMAKQFLDKLTDRNKK